ncbi:thiosulfate sulfurtransferase [Nitratiruptor sp. YY09-18]|nr:thiosulfate sulfurtransferase [Nitratiruptor sp. YY09-18]
MRTAGEYIYAGHPLEAISVPIFSYAYKPKDIKLRINFAKKEQNRALDAHKVYEITPIENKNFLEDVKKIRHKLGNKPILVICRIGGRSKYAANLLAKNGMREVYNVDGGFLEWKRAKLPYGGE